MKTLKKLATFTLLSLSSLFACGPGSYYSDFAKENYYNFLDASLVGVDEDNPLYSFSGHLPSYGTRVEYFKEIKYELNIKEWQSYFKNRLTVKEVNELFYGENSTLLKRYKNYAQKINDPAFENYLKFIDRQSKNVMEYEEGSVSNSKLSKEAMEAFTKEEDAFLKLRYLFLAMRLAHYEGEFKKTLALYEQHYKEVSKVESIVVEWIDALRAGALQHLGKSVESNRLYAQILKNNKTNAHLGYYDFRIHNDEDWKALLAKAQDTDEKAEFYFLRALKWEGSPLMEHEAMAKVAPKSIWFERLTYMIMQEFQEEAFEYETTENKNNKYVKEERKVYELKEKRFLKTMASLENPSFFDVYAQVYLKFFKTGKLETTNFAKLKNMAKGKEQNSVELLNYLEKVVQVKKGSQEALFKTLEKLSKKVSPELETSLFNYTALHNVSLYEALTAKRIYSKIFSDSTEFSQWDISRDAISAESFEEYVEEKNRNYYEQKLFKKSMGILEKNDVAKTLAFLYIKDGNFKKAQKYLKQVPALNRKTDYNPFNVSLSGNNRKASKKGYKQRKFVETMLKIEESLKKNPKSAMDHYLYANGLYNTSWFGNSPMFASIWRTTTSIGVERAKHIAHNFDAIEKEYTLALKYATKKEFKAKIAYQLLKVKFNKEILLENVPYISEFGDDWGDKTVVKLVNKSKDLREKYENYKAKYKDTKYGKEIIKSCATFGYFR